MKNIINANIDLHVHPFLNNNCLIDVVKAMDDTNLDVVALEDFNGNLYPTLKEKAATHYKKATFDEAGIKLYGGKYLLNAGEYNTQENLHVITVGYSYDADPKTEIRRIIDNGLRNDALVILDHPFVDNVLTRTAGHVSAEREKSIEYLCQEYSGQIAMEWNAYCIPWMRWGLKMGLKATGHKAEYHDVNGRAEALSQKLWGNGFNVHLIPDTDLHARSKGLLSAMGTSRIITDLEGECAKDILGSMKRNIFSGKYESIKKYISSFHLFRAFCLPVLFPNHFYRPRA